MERDKQLLNSVQDLLAREPELKPFLNYVYLNVKSGKVTINGWVPNIFVKNRILEVISGITGAKLFSENLKVDQSHQRVGVAFDWSKGRMALS
jgi:hypothetical protein